MSKKQPKRFGEKFWFDHYNNWKPHQTLKSEKMFNFITFIIAFFGVVPLTLTVI